MGDSAQVLLWSSVAKWQNGYGSEQNPLVLTSWVSENPPTWANYSSVYFSHGAANPQPGGSHDYFISPKPIDTQDMTESSSWDKSFCAASQITEAQNPSHYVKAAYPA